MVTNLAPKFVPDLGLMTDLLRDLAPNLVPDLAQSLVPHLVPAGRSIVSGHLPGTLYPGIRAKLIYPGNLGSGRIRVSGQTGVSGYPGNLGVSRLASVSGQNEAIWDQTCVPGHPQNPGLCLLCSSAHCLVCSSGRCLVCSSWHGLVCSSAQ